MQANESLFEPGEYLQPGRPGWFSVLAKDQAGMAQASYPLEALPAVVELADADKDTWLTQAVFRLPNRRAVNVRDVGLLFADLDTYRTPGLVGKTPEELAALLLIYCGQEGLPAPSIVLYSGRGLQAKWLLSASVEAGGLVEWNQAQLALVRLLEPFSADQAARDISRVLRLDRTVNTKSGERCRVVHVTGGLEACPARYDFEELRAVLCGREASEPTRPQRASSPSTRPRILALPAEFNFRRLNWYRLYDLRDLWAARGGVPEGFRELSLFWELNFLLRAEPGKAGDLWREAQTLAAQIAPGVGFYQASDLSTLYQRAQAWRNGETCEFQGREYPPLYTPRNQYLLDLFRIEPAEERGLRTIISRAEKYRRAIEKARAAGVRAREEYLETALERIRPWETLGVSRATWYRHRAASAPPSPSTKAGEYPAR